MKVFYDSSDIVLKVYQVKFYPLRYYTLEYQQTEKIETEVSDDDRIRKHTGVRRLSRVSFWGIPFSQYQILVHPCQQTPLKKGNPQMESFVQDNPAAPSPCQYTLKVLWNSVLG